MSTKCDIFNYALGALLLTKQLSDVELDNTTEAKVLRLFWPTAFKKTLTDLDLDGTATRVALSLVKQCPVPDWHFAYLYPADCARFRRLLHPQCEGWHSRRVHKDTRSTQIPRQIAEYQNQKVIFTNKCDVWAEYISLNLPITDLSEHAALALAYKLAELSSPLIAGKGAGPLRKELREQYMVEKGSAQQQDREENATFDEDWVMSEFVEARLS